MTSPRRIFCLFSISLVLAVLNAQAQATATTAVIEGSVVDNALHPVSGAEVSAVESSSGYRFQADTDSRGRFRLAPLAPGSYVISSVDSRLTRIARPRSLTLNAGDTVSIQFVLEL